MLVTRLCFGLVASIAIAGCGRSAFESQDDLSNSTPTPGSSSTPASSPGASPTPLVDETDLGFGSQGRTFLSIGNHDTVARRSALDPMSGDIVVIGDVSASSSRNTAVALYDESGKLDSNFAGSGWASIDAGVSKPDWGTAVLPLGDGTYFAAGGLSSNNVSRSVIARFGLDGSLVASFGTNGTLSLNFSLAASEARALAMDLNGRTWIASDAATGGAGGVHVWSVARLTAEGALDTAFGNKGHVDIGLDSVFQEAELDDAAITPDGGVILAGSQHDQVLLVKLTPNGALDSTFDSNGAKSYGLPASAKADVRSIALDASGRWVVCGDASDSNGSKDVFVLRALATGALDSTFGGTGIAVIDLGASNDRAGRAIVFPDSSISVGASSGGLGVLRLKADGTRDAAWGGNGWALSSSANAGDSAQDALALPDGRVVVVGSNPASPETFVLAAFKPS